MIPNVTNIPSYFTLRMLGIMIAVGLAAATSASAAPQAGIPAILQFAEQYQQQSAVDSAQETASTQNESLPKTASPIKKSVATPARWQTQEGQIQRQQRIISRLEREVALLKKNVVVEPSSPTRVEPDLDALAKLAQGLRQALALTPTEVQIRERQRLAQQQRAQAQTIQNSLQTENQALKDQLSALSRQQQQQQNELQQKYTALQAELDANIASMNNLTAKVKPAKIQAEKLKLPSVRQDYAAGVSLGEEILQMHTERQRWGVNVDKETLLAGIVDTFSGQRQLDDASLTQALTDSEELVTQARNSTISAQKQQGDTYLAAFKKDKQVKTTADGAWYRIDYVGDSPIPSDATVDVIVKETLTDGTVIQDMEASNTVLSQPLAQFPPLFADALRQLKNHGSLTLVVPPALAYGDKGYPPNVPPNATMVYTLRIAEMYPAGQKKKERTQTSSPPQ